MDVTAVNGGLEVEGLIVEYRGVRVIDELSLSVPPGAIVAIIGRSGCGKSTLLRSLCGLQQPLAGTLRVGADVVLQDGEWMCPEVELRRRAMMVTQQLSLVPWLTARENIALGLRTVRGHSSDRASAAVNDISSALGISSVLHHYPEELSGGQAQRVQLARAAVLFPEYLFLDEVTSSLDPLTIREVIEALRKLRTQFSTERATWMITTHLLAFAYEFADLIAFMHSGRILEVGPAHNFELTARRTETLSFLRALDLSHM